MDTVYSAPPVCENKHLLPLGKKTGIRYQDIIRNIQTSPGDSISMKITTLLLLCVVLVLSIGMVNAEQIPNLTGTWLTTSGTVVLFTGETQELGASADIWSISQQDLVITGTNSFYIGDELIEEFFTGIITPDGKTVYIVDKNGGLYIANPNEDDTMTVSYVNTGEVRDKPGYGLALTMTLEKQTE